MAINTGVNISKLLAYAVLAPPTGVEISKLNAYAVLSTPKGVNVTKLLGYAVLENPNVNSPVWPIFTFNNGVVGSPYSQTWDLSPAAPPTTYTLVSGALPAGLSLSNLTGDQGKIDGTPTTAGASSFTLRATNAYGTADKAFSITINVAPSGSGGGSWTWLA